VLEQTNKEHRGMGWSRGRTNDTVVQGQVGRIDDMVHRRRMEECGFHSLDRETRDDTVERHGHLEGIMDVSNGGDRRWNWLGFQKARGTARGRERE
jgi:hypothetical protein